MIEELIRIDVEQGRSRVIVFSFTDEGKIQTLSKVEFQRSVVLEFLRMELNDSILEIGHLSNGVPYIIGSDVNISISHSNQFYAVYISKDNGVGVDVQSIKADIKKGINYFVNDIEQSSIESSLKNLHLIWSAKEAVYKLKKGDIELYKEDMTVLEIEPNFLTLQCKNQIVKCGYHYNDEFTLVYTFQTLFA